MKVLGIAVDEAPYPDPKPTRRGTTNGNARGGSEDRRKRRHYLIETYRADADLSAYELQRMPWQPPHHEPVPFGSGEPACRCYRCGTLLSVDTVTVDRIITITVGGGDRHAGKPGAGQCGSVTIELYDEEPFHA